RPSRDGSQTRPVRPRDGGPPRCRPASPRAEADSPPRSARAVANSGPSRALSARIRRSGSSRSRAFRSPFRRRSLVEKVGAESTVQVTACDTGEAVHPLAQRGLRLRHSPLALRQELLLAPFQIADHVLQPPLDLTA